MKQSMLKASGFAVIGASRDPNKVGHVVFKNLLKGKVKAYPVNIKAKSILGHKCYQSVIELKGNVSHAVIAVPARFVPSIIDECGAAGVKVAIIITAGFSEAGNKALEDELIKTAAKYSVRIIGPNVLGLIVPGQYNASFFEGEIKSGGASFISQSGALGVGVLDSLVGKEHGLRSFISVGNMAGVTITDALKESLADKKTCCVMIYAESLKQGRKFMSLCEQSTKPVFILKAGISKAGKRAASTHTGSLAGSNRIYEAAFKQCGARRVNSLKSLINSAMTYDKYGHLYKHALIITNAGGPGILMTDSLAKQGIKTPKLPKKLLNKLEKELKGVAWSQNNPIDIVGDAQADRYARVLNSIKDFHFYDEVIVLLTPQAMTEPLKTAKEIVKTSKRIGKPIIPCFIGGPSVKTAIDYMESEGLIVFKEINELAETIRNLFLV